MSGENGDLTIPQLKYYLRTYPPIILYPYNVTLNDIRIFISRLKFYSRVFSHGLSIFVNKIHIRFSYLRRNRLSLISCLLEIFAHFP